MKGNCAIPAEVDTNSGLLLEFEDEFGIHLGRSFRERLQFLWIMGIAVGQHAAGGVRGFATEFTAFEQQGLAAPLMEFERNTQADYAAADDDCIPTLHIKIVANTERWCDFSER